MRVSLTTQAHNLIRKHLVTDDIAIDATVGNGHDTLFLSTIVGVNGVIFGFDIQHQAIDSARSRIEDKKQCGQTRLLPICHSQMEQYIPSKYHGKIKTIMFNLGYLPGSDKSIITQSNTTLIALNQSINLLSPNGIITIAAYPGHSGGEVEANLIRQWCEKLNPEQYSSNIIYSSDKETAPRLFVILKNQFTIIS